MADNINPEIVGLAEQKALAKALLQQGMNQNLQGQMVSGRYVGASPWEGIAKLANIWAGKSMGREAAEKEQAILQEQQAKQNANLQTALNQFYGTPEFVQQGPTPTGGNIPVQPAQKPDRNLALATLLAPEGGPTSKALAAKLLEKDFEPPKQHVLSPGAVLVDEKGNKIFAAPNKPTGEGEGGGYPTVNNNGVRVGTYYKTGGYRSPTGQSYSSKAMDEARAEHDAATDLAFKLNQLSKDDIKNAYGSAFDYSSSKVGQMVGNKNVVDAQTKINSLQIGSVLKNLSQLKGASSDKEMAQMIKDFPGYTASPDVMEKWVERAALATNRFLKRSEGRFGFDTDYAEQGRFGSKPKEQKGEIAAPGAPKVGEIRSGQDGKYRFKGGDQYDQKNWEKVAS